MALVSFRHGLVFVKTAKTAGTSIETDLSQRLEEAAIVTPILPPEPGHVARNYLGPDGTPAFQNHMPATQIRALIGADRFDSMTRICVEREPVEKCISQFHLLRNSPLHNPDGSYRKSWDAYVEDGKFPNSVAAYTEICDGVRVSLMTHILRYDRLAQDLPPLLDKLGIPDFVLRSRAKADYSRNVLVTPADVSPAQRARIYNAFRDSLRVCGFDWQA
ncbi:hypothetical protein [Salipiger aestuarii]|uniref:hypothetical protein n=1 Tax=Salipiger aestuarii TaxID=568098 RepID=UPI00123A3431|nr:hypothetical protein [Salipiger aestuarii]KAA8609000.1 hypothetical protein AL037_15810 [Salipiger aestuarii]